MASPRALLLSADPAVIEMAQGARASCNLQLGTCASPKEAGARLRKGGYSVLIVHLTNGDDQEQLLPLLWTITSTRKACATVALSEHFTEDQIANLLRAGVADCLTLPLAPGRLTRVLQEMMCLTTPERPAESPLAPEPEDLMFDAFTPDLASLVEQVRRVAPQETTLLLTGETGTGKTRLARLIHQLSARRAEPFLVVDCGSLSPSLIESELFGHAKGAFTGADRERTGKLAAAGGGTLLLDEVNSLPLHLQGKLLRAVDERAFEPVGSERTVPVRARLIAASNAPLEREVEAGRFRADLYFRLNVVGFFLPPLRDRRAAIPGLLGRFLRELAERNRPEVTGFTDEALRSLQEYDWPGNVREVRNAVKRAVCLCAGPRIELEDLPEAIQRFDAQRKGDGGLVGRSPVPACDPMSSTLALSKQEVEIRRILEALQKHNNNRLRAAHELGISRVALYKKLNKYGLMTPRYQSPGRSEG